MRQLWGFQILYLIFAWVLGERDNIVGRPLSEAHVFFRNLAAQFSVHVVALKKIIFLCSCLTLAQSLEYILLLATASVDREHLWDQISIVKVKQTIIYVKIFVQFCVSAGLLY